MTALEYFRNRFGFSQEQLAVYLSVSKSLVMMVEKSHRSLATNALPKLAKLQQINIETASPNIKLLVKSLKETPSTLQKQAKMHAQKAEICKRTLAAMQNKFQQAVNRLALIESLQKQLADGEEGKKEKLWSNVQQAESLSTINKFGIEAQKLLQWKIACFEFAATTALEI